MTLLSTLNVAGAYITAVDTAKHADAASDRTANTILAKRANVAAPLLAFWKARTA